MDQTTVKAKWAEAASLVEALPEAERREARIAVMAALLRDVKAPTSGADGGTTEAPVEPEGDAPTVSSVRQLSRFLRRKGVTGSDAVVLYGWFLKRSGGLITSKGCRDHWVQLTGKSGFAQTIILRTEERGWVEPVQGAEEQQWRLTGVGYNVALKLMTDVEEPVKA